MSKTFKTVDHILFVACGEGLDRINRGGSSILNEGYIDHQGKVNAQKEPGKYVTFVSGKDARGQDKPRRFKLDESLRRLQTRISDIDVYGTKLYDWLKNYPDCEGSPYGTYDAEGQQQGVIFRELNTAKDAEVALQADELRINAQADVLALDDETLTEISAVIGHYGPADKLMRLKVVEFAGKRPSDYFSIKDAGDRSIRSIVRVALNKGVFTTKGDIIYWNSTVIGGDEDAAVAKLLNDQDMVDALQENLGLKSKVKVENKKRPGNPNFSKKPTEPTEQK